MKTYIKFLLNIYLNSFVRIFGIMTILIMIIGIFEEIEFFKNLRVGTFYPIFLSILNTPSVVYEILPFIFLISTQFFFMKLVENNELEIFKYNGLTNINILKIITLFTACFSLILVLLFYNFSSKFKNYYLEIKNSYSNDNKYLAVITENGLWIKDEIAQTINIVNASKIDSKFLLDVLITQFDNKYNHLRTIQSPKVDISKNIWVIKNAKISENNVSKEFAEIQLRSNFDLNKINSLFSNLSSLSFWELYKLRNDYKSLNYSTTEIDSHVNKIFSYPFYLTIITILSGIIMFNIRRQKNSIFKIVFGIFISVIIYYINNFFNVLGVNERIPLLLSIWLPLIMLSVINLASIVRLNEK